MPSDDAGLIRAVVFDLDGTLIDSLPDIRAAANEVLAGRGYSPFSLDEYRTLVGDGVYVLFTRALHREDVSEAVIKECALEFKKAYAQLWRTSTLPYPGVAELLDGITAMKLPMAILSNKPHDFTVEIVGEILSQWHFDEVVGQRDHIKPKPDPAGLIEIASRLKIAPSDILYVGDTNTDMQTAVAANSIAAGVLWGFRDADELLQSGAGHLFDTPSVLAAHIRQNSFNR